MKNKKTFGKFGAKGYYIALILCAAAIGISGYLYYRNATQDEPQLQDPTPSAPVGNPTENTLPVVGPQPDDPQKDPQEDPQTPVLKTQLPLQGETISQYAMECLAYNQTTRDWRTHNGIDIAAEAGTAVCAAADGTVYTTYSDATMGTTVVIRHSGGYVTVYSSLSPELSVKPGDTVTMGQTIGTVGNTALLECAIGDHLHFSVTHNDKHIDPAEFFDLQ